MVDEKLIEEIVRRVVAKLAAEGLLTGADDTRGGPMQAAAPPSAPAPTAPARRADPQERRHPPASQTEPHVGRVLTEWDVLLAHRSGRGYLRIRPKTIVTPLARDRARDLRVDIVVDAGG